MERLFLSFNTPRLAEFPPDFNPMTHDNFHFVHSPHNYAIYLLRYRGFYGLTVRQFGFCVSEENEALESKFPSRVGVWAGKINKSLK